MSAPPKDPLGAFCRDNHAALPGAAEGRLRGKTFAAKDVFDIAGSRTGFGQPDWLRTHPPASATASAVQRLLAAGADLVGRTISDELCYSLTGDNVHYGAPSNPRAPGRITGGSSSGSAAAVSGSLVDFALGTDCGGSVRVPASYCGIFGIRTTHGRIATDGVVPFAESFDVVGWLARDAFVLRNVGTALLDAPAAPPTPRRLLLAEALFGRAEDSLRAAAFAAVPRFVDKFEDVVNLSDDFAELDAWRTVFQTVQGAEIWANLGAWITATQPKFGPGIRERFAAAAAITAEQATAARARMADIRARIRDLICPGDALCLPTTPRVAPPRDSPPDEMEVAYRNQAMSLLCIAGLGGLPQISVPVRGVAGVPAGLSLVGAAGADEMLLTVALP
jgi:amidase